jgi:hypothetical protein
MSVWCGLEARCHETLYKTVQRDALSHSGKGIVARRAALLGVAYKNGTQEKSAPDAHLMAPHRKSPAGALCAVGEDIDWSGFVWSTWRHAIQ